MTTDTRELEKRLGNLGSSVGMGVAQLAADALSTIQLQREEIERLTREKEGWESDAGIMKANWNAACNDIHELQQRASRLEEALREAIRFIRLTSEGMYADERADKLEAALSQDQRGQPEPATIVAPVESLRATPGPAIPPSPEEGK